MSMCKQMMDGLPRAIMVELLTSYLGHVDLLHARLVSKGFFEAIFPFIAIMHPGAPFWPPATVRDMWLVGSLDMPIFASWFDPNNYASLQNIIVNVESMPPEEWQPYEDLFLRAFEQPVAGDITLFQVNGPEAFVSALLNHPRIQTFIDPLTSYSRLDKTFWYETHVLSRIDPIWGSPFAPEMQREDLRCLWQSVHGNQDIETAVEIFMSGGNLYDDQMKTLIDKHRRPHLIKQLQQLDTMIMHGRHDVRELYWSIVEIYKR